MTKVKKRSPRIRRTLKAEQEIEGGRLVEKVVATEELPDGTVTEAIRETVEDRSADVPWFSTGTSRTVIRKTKKL